MKIFNVSQGSSQWHLLRRGWSDESGSFTPFRFTASQIYFLSGRSRFKTREDYLKEVTGTTINREEPNEHMLRGTRLEPIIRKMYERRSGNAVTEVGFVIPNWCPFIGVSPDGFVEDDGCIEIKAPCKMYDTPKPEHYAQMQMQMAVCEKSWCDYVVYVEDTNELKITRIPYDHYYWENTLYPLIKEGIKDGLEIILKTCLSDLVSD
jgi:putative phage-type endonuclease